jgi:cation transport regulator
MPYDSVKELPASVRNNLPRHALEVYKAAYNNAWKEYKNPKDRKGGASREEVSHKVAWSAVKSVYEKKNGKWRRKKEKKVE